MIYAYVLPFWHCQQCSAINVNESLEHPAKLCVSMGACRAALPDVPDKRSAVLHALPPMHTSKPVGRSEFPSLYVYASMQKAYRHSILPGNPPHKHLWLCAVFLTSTVDTECCRPISACCAPRPPSPTVPRHRTFCNSQPLHVRQHRHCTPETSSHTKQMHCSTGKHGLPTSRQASRQSSRLPVSDRSGTSAQS